MPVNVGPNRGEHHGPRDPRGGFLPPAPRVLSIFRHPCLSLETGGGRTLEGPAVFCRRGRAHPGNHPAGVCASASSIDRGSARRASGSPAVRSSADRVADQEKRNTAVNHCQHKPRNCPRQGRPRGTPQRVESALRSHADSIPQAAKVR